MSLAENIERSVEQLNITTRAETDRHILEDAFAAFEKSVKMQSSSVTSGTGRRIIRIRMAQLAAVAAVVLVVFALFLDSSAREIKLGDVYQAMGKVQNICITTFEPTSAEPMQIEWVSQSLNINMSRIGRQFVLLDIPNKLKMTKNISSGSVEVEMLSGDTLSRVERAAVQRFGLFPFSNITDVSDAKWTRIDNSETEIVMPGTRVYELSLEQTKIASGLINLRKWRVFLDKNTALPRRIEWYPKRRPEDDYEFETYDIVTYPDEKQIQTLIHSTFGATALQPREPGYIGTPLN
ncbi:MAG: hypothetical protein JW837_03895 [Sedimentisphaerales bacterium]|nr:hypothetical protein [Sedimentisphaerales bacterium]